MLETMLRITQIIGEAVEELGIINLNRRKHTEINFAINFEPELFFLPEIDGKGGHYIRFYDRKYPERGDNVNLALYDYSIDGNYNPEKDYLYFDIVTPCEVEEGVLEEKLFSITVDNFSTDNYKVRDITARW